MINKLDIKVGDIIAGKEIGLARSYESLEAWTSKRLLNDHKPRSRKRLIPAGEKRATNKKK